MVRIRFGMQPTDWDDSRREIFPRPTAVETRRSKKKFGGEERQYCVDCHIILVPGQVVQQTLSIRCRSSKYLSLVLMYLRAI